MSVVFVPAGRLVASLMLDFLQVFHLDFTLAVFHPEINSVSERRSDRSETVAVTLRSQCSSCFLLSARIFSTFKVQ